MGGQLTQWYYFDSRIRRGPVMTEDLQSLFDAGRLPGDTMIREAEERADWQKAHKVGVFRTPAVADRPTSISSSLDLPFDQGYSVQENWKSGLQIRPWVRYWARSFDFFYFALSFGFVSGFLGIAQNTQGDLSQAVASLLAFYFLWVLVESAMLSTFGTTPGKWLLNIRVRTSSGEKLPFLDAFSRSLGWWISGFGLGIPLISLLTLITSYLRLTRQGAARWDEKGGFVVSHREIGAGRGSLFLLFFLGPPIALLVLAFIMFGVAMMAAMAEAGM